ncbi:Sip1-related alpha-galactosidase [Paenibacillus sp.]|uniref:Sip1-related alpha-galactosidase n=1 Tax=Paenibacillus sp. TaxID=58172 RepID=UPI002D38BF74|nr:Sip1-related alpha-galactosidase [Paenibacillus sp.]HZG87079.1 Sip1-related alpha-galactosidase [Paenibacillus sp.]
MFSVREQDQGFDLLFDGAPVLEKVELAAARSDGANVPLRLRDVRLGAGGRAGRLDAEARATLAFSSGGDGNGAVAAELDVVSAGAHAAVFVRALVENKELFRDRLHFAPFEALAVRVGGVPGLEALMANYQHKDWWTRPFFEPDVRKLPPKTLSLLWRTTDRYAHVLPVTDKAYRADLRGGERGLEVRIASYRGGLSECRTLAFVLGVGADPYRLAADGAETALRALDAETRPRAEKRYPEAFDYLGWCSWDAFYHAVDAEGLLRKTKELHELGVPVRWAMIDDGWSETREKRLASYDADKRKFPEGLAPVIRRMKREHGIRWVGVWHTIAGYWGGVDPEGELFARNRQYLYETGGGAWVPAPSAAAAFGFWNDWHGYLKRQGVDFVKVDSQSAIANFFSEFEPIGRAAEAAHAALEASVGLHFDGCVINCMGMASENIWHRPASAVSRSSDDFVPEAEFGFAEHALQNAYNSFFHGTLYWGDWDMFWTDHRDDRRHMALRAVSGGPIYISDKPGRTKPELLRPLVYRDGRIIRCDLPGQPTEDCLTVDPISSKAPLKIWNRAGRAGVLAAFHLRRDAEAVAGSIGPSDIPGLAGEAFLVYDHNEGRAFRLRKDERREIALPPNGANVYVIVPEDASGMTPIGLIDKLAASAAVTSFHAEEDRAFVRLVEGGRFAFASAREPASVRANGRPAAAEPWNGEARGYIVDCGDLAGPVAIDIAFGGE